MGRVWSFLLAAILTVTFTALAQSAPPHGRTPWTCTVKTDSNFNITVYTGHLFWSTGEPFTVDTGDGAAGIVLNAQTADALHLHGVYRPATVIGVGGANGGYYTSVIVNLCGRVFPGQTAIVMAPVRITRAMDSLDGGTYFAPNLIGLPFLVENRLSFTLNTVTDAVTFKQAADA